MRRLAVPAGAGRLTPVLLLFDNLPRRRCPDLLVTLTPRAQREFRQLCPTVREAVREGLACPENFQYPRSIPLKGRPDLWRFRTGKVRVIFRREDDGVVVQRIAYRRCVYRRLGRSF